MTEKQMFEATRIMNDPLIGWKVKRALLVHLVGLSDELVNDICPKPKERLRSYYKKGENKCNTGFRS